MEGLFYSIKDKKLFYVPSYYTHGTGQLTQLIIKTNTRGGYRRGELYKVLAQS